MARLYCFPGGILPRTPRTHHPHPEPTLLKMIYHRRGLGNKTSDTRIYHSRQGYDCLQYLPRSSQPSTSHKKKPMYLGQAALLIVHRYTPACLPPETVLRTFPLDRDACPGPRPCHLPRGRAKGFGFQNNHILVACLMPSLAAAAAATPARWRGAARSLAVLAATPARGDALLFPHGTVTSARGEYHILHLYGGASAIALASAGPRRTASCTDSRFLIWFIGSERCAGATELVTTFVSNPFHTLPAHRVTTKSNRLAGRWSTVLGEPACWRTGGRSASGGGAAATGAGAAAWRRCGV